MSRRNGWHGRLALAVAVVAVASLGITSAAGAATPTVSLAGGTTTIKLSGATTRALKALKIKVTATKPAKSGAGGLAFPISRRGSKIDPKTAAGTIVHTGGLVLSSGATRVALGAPTLRIGKGGSLSAKLGRTSIPLATVSGGRVSRTGFATNLAGAQLRLTGPAARALNGLFSIRAFRGGLVLGTASVKSTPAQIALDSGTATLAVDPATGGALTQLGVGLGPAPGATATSPTTLAFRVTGGLLSPSGTAGTIQSSGGLALTQGSTNITLTNPLITLARSSTLTVTYSGAPVAIADVASSAVTTKVDAKSRTVTIGGVTPRLNSLAAQTLDSLLSTSAIPAGLTIGTITLTAHAR